MDKWTIILLILVFIIGLCVGVLFGSQLLYPAAYPGPGDWNGDGILSFIDVFTAIDYWINGPRYPEIVYG